MPFCCSELVLLERINRHGPPMSDAHRSPVMDWISSLVRCCQDRRDRGTAYMATFYFFCCHYCSPLFEPASYRLGSDVHLGPTYPTGNELSFGRHAKIFVMPSVDELLKLNDQLFDPHQSRPYFYYRKNR